ncbi:MAG: hypothetical protein LPK03_12915 [Pontibacter sp.]|nr:hypothetical protein [Pontibacter sp.]
MKRLVGTLTLAISALSVQAQDVYMPYNRDTYHLVDRYQIKYGSQVPNMHTAVRPYGRADVAELAEISARNAQNAVDEFNTTYLLNDNWNYTNLAQNESRKPFLSYFYRNKTDLYHVDTEDFVLRVNPVLHFEVGVDSESDGVRYINTRGVQVEGNIDERFGFYAFVGENQARFAE